MTPHYRVGVTLEIRIDMPQTPKGIAAMFERVETIAADLEGYLYRPCQDSGYSDTVIDFGWYVFTEEEAQALMDAAVAGCGELSLPVKSYEWHKVEAPGGDYRIA